jgi:hypothetical protein
LRRGGEAGADERKARGLRIGHEMPDMVEKDFLAQGQLAVDLRMRR